jgi:hypothetical protein
MMDNTSTKLEKEWLVPSSETMLVSMVETEGTHLTLLHFWLLARRSDTLMWI